MRLKTTLLAAAAASALLAAPAWAAPPVWGAGPGDIHRFHEHDMMLWRHGRWHQGFHAGRNGWWWIVGGVWYFYPQPVYPYPDPYTPPVMPMAPQPQPAQVWYYCHHPEGYYPYVAECRHWQVVPAQPQ